MGSFARHNEGTNSYLMSQQMVMPIAYGSQFGSSHGQQSNPSPGIQHLQYTPEHTIPSMSTSDDMRLHHPPQYVAQSCDLQFPKGDIESQESQRTMLSEPVVPPLDGYPDIEEFDGLMQNYVDDLSPKKKDKALIHAERAQYIGTVLIDPNDTAVESAQFRFWVKKMFKLQAVGAGTADCRKMICHKGKPVAIREKLFKILTKAHQQCRHGGRDKTYAEVRRIYSWVPKELVFRFVKSCPICRARRGGSRLTPPSSRRRSPCLKMLLQSPKLPSPPIIKTESSYASQMTLDLAQSDYLVQLHSHGWMDGHQNLQSRSGSGTGIRSFHDSTGNSPHSITGTLDPVSADLAVPPSQLSYTAGYLPTYGNVSQRDF